MNVELRSFSIFNRTKGQTMRKWTVLVFWLLLAAWNAGQADQPPQENQPGSIDEALAAAKARGQIVLVHFFSPG